MHDDTPRLTPRACERHELPRSQQEGDGFNGDTPHLISCIQALLDLDAAKALAPHGIGGHARALLTAAAARLATPIAAPAGQPATSSEAAPAPVATLTDEELADCGLLSELDDGEAVEVRKENGA
jgi:hypothetical protein